MAKTIETIEALKVGTTETEVRVNSRAFLIQNLSESAIVYFKEKREDNKKVTATTGFAIPAGHTLEVTLRARKLSLVASAANTDVRIMYVSGDV